MDKEEIQLSKWENDLPLERYPSVVPSDAARYHFFLFKHTHEGDYLESIGLSFYQFLVIVAFFKTLFSYVN